MPEDKKYKLWEKLNSTGYYTKSYEDFNTQFATPESQTKLYSALNNSGYYTKSSEEFIGSFFQPSSSQTEAVVEEKTIPVEKAQTENPQKNVRELFLNNYNDQNSQEEKKPVATSVKPNAVFSKKEILLKERLYGSDSPTVQQMQEHNKRVETGNKIKEAMLKEGEAITQVGDLWYTQTEISQKDQLTQKAAEAQARLDQITLSANPDEELSKLILSGNAKGTTVEENRINAEKDLFAAQAALNKIDVKSKFRDPQNWIAYYDTKTMQPVAIPNSKSEMDAQLNNYYLENLKGRKDYVSNKESSEFQANSFNELSPSAQRVVRMEYANRFIPKDEFQKYLNDNNLDFDLDMAPHAGNAFLKGFTNTSASILKGADISKLPAADALNTLYVKYKNGLITQSEYERAYGDLKESMLDFNNQYSSLGVYEDGVLKTSKKLPGLEPFKTGKSTNSGGETRFDEYYYSKDQVEKWLSKMPTAEEIENGATSPYQYEKGGLGQAAESLQKYADSLKQNPALKENIWLSEVPQALGSSVPFLVTAAASSFVGAPTWLVPAITGGLANASDAYDQAIQAGATPNEAKDAFMIGFGIGTSEAIPIDRMLSRFDGGIGWQKKLLESFKQGSEEAIQEAFQSISNDALAKGIYDESRKIGEDLESNAAIGFVSGFIMGGSAALLSREDATPAQKEMVVKAQNNLKAWMAANGELEAEANGSRSGMENPIIEPTPNVAQEEIQVEEQMQEPIQEAEVPVLQEEPVIEEAPIAEELPVIEETPVLEDQQIPDAEAPVNEEEQLPVEENNGDKPTTQSGSNPALRDVESTAKAFKDAGEKSKKDQSPKALGNFIIDNSKVGDKIIINEDSYYEVVSKKTNKKGQTETELQFFAKNDDTGKFENIPSAVKLFTDKYRGTDQEKLGYRDAADLFESSYTNSKGERVTEQSTYEPKSESLLSKEQPTSTTQSTVFKLKDKSTFYHASDYKRDGRLRPNTAPQFGTGVYFSTSKEVSEREFGDKNTTEVELAIENPVYTGTKEWYEVERLAIKMADEEYGKKNKMTLEEDAEFYRYDPENSSEIDEIPAHFISDAAKQLGHDAIIDEGSMQYENEVVVLDESKIIYPEDKQVNVKEEPKVEEVKADAQKFTPKVKKLEPVSESNPLLIKTNRGTEVTYKDVEKLDNGEMSIKDVQVGLNIPYNQAARAYKEYNTIKKANQPKVEKKVSPKLDIKKRDAQEVFADKGFINAAAKEPRQVDKQKRQYKLVDFVVDDKGKIHHIGKNIPADIQARIDSGELAIETNKVILDKETLNPTKIIRESLWKKENRPLNAIEKMRKIINRFEPKTLDEAIDKFLAMGGKVKPEDFVRFTGFKKGSSEYNQSKWAFDNEATGYDEYGTQHFKEYAKKGKNDNEVQMAEDVMKRIVASQGKGAIMQDIVEKQEDKEFMDEHDGRNRDEYERLMEEQRLHDEAAKKLADEEVQLIAAYEQQLIDADAQVEELVEIYDDILTKLIEKHADKNGELDFEAAMQDQEFANLIELLPNEIINQILNNENKNSKPKGNADEISNPKKTSTKAETIQQKIAAAEAELNDLLEIQKKQSTEVSRLKKELDKILNENQLDMFGNNKPQGLFNDKAEVQKNFDEKENELKKTDAQVAALQEQLTGLKDADKREQMERAGQRRMELKDDADDIRNEIEERKKKIRELRAGRNNPGIENNQAEQNAKILYEYTQLALLHIKLGINTLEDFANSLGEVIDDVITAAWEKANNPNDGEEEPLPIGVTNAYTNAMLQALGKDPIAKDARKVNQVLWDTVVEKIQKGLIDPRQVVMDIAEAESPAITDEQQAVILFDRVRISNEMAVLNRQLEMHIESGNVNLANTVIQRLSQIEIELDLNALANTKAGREWGRMGQFRQRMAQRDYSLASILVKAKNMATVGNGKGKVKESSKELLKELAKEHERLQGQIIELQQKMLEREQKYQEELAAERKKLEEALIDKVKDDLKKKASPKNQARISTRLRNFADKVEKGQISKLGGYRASTAFDAMWDAALKTVAATLRATGKLTDAIETALEEIRKSDWYKSLTEDKDKFESDFKAHIESQFEEDAAPDLETLNEEFQTMLDELDLAAEAFGLTELDGSMRSIFNDMLYNRVEAGDKTIDDVVDSIYQAVVQILPNVTQTEIRDFISGYGRFTKLSKEEIDVDVREIKRQGRLDASLEAVKNGELPLRSGVERDEPTAEARAKQAEILRIIKEKNIEPTLTDAEIEEQWRTGLEAYHRRLTNAIEDIENEIKTRQKKVRGVKKVYDDQKSKDLRAELEALREIRDNVFKLPPKTPEQKATEAAIRGAQRRIEELNRRINEFDLTPVKPKSKVVETPELKALRDQKKGLEDKIDAMKKALNPPKTSEQKATEAAIRATEKVIDKINEGIANLKAGKTEDGEIYPEKSKPNPTQVNARLEALRNLRNRLKEEREALLPESVRKRAAIEKYKKARNKRLHTLEERLRNKDFEPKKKTEPPTPDAEIIELNKKIRAVENEVNLEMERIKLANRSGWRKAADLALELFNLPKALIASVDMSAPLRQGVFLIGKVGSFTKALGEMFRQAFSQKNADNWLDDLRQTDAYLDMKNTYKLYISEPTAHLSAKEESFMSNLLKIFHKVPVYGALLKGSERAYAGFLNKLRVDVFLNFRQNLIDEGLAGEDLKKELIGYAKFINNATGRGSLGIAEPMAPVLNGIFFSPKLIMSRINTLNPVFYARLPKKARKDAILSLLKFAGIGTTVLVLAQLAWGGEGDDDEVEIESRSTFIRVWKNEV
jgi:hypothetical protein